MPWQGKIQKSANFRPLGVITVAAFRKYLDAMPDTATLTIHSTPGDRPGESASWSVHASWEETFTHD